MTTPKTVTSAAPSVDDLHLAAQWLDVYEGAEDAQACQRVRAWLLKQADAAEFREACRAAGVPVAQARKALRLSRRQPLRSQGDLASTRSCA